MCSLLARTASNLGRSLVVVVVQNKGPGPQPMALTWNSTKEEGEKVKRVTKVPG